VHGICCVREWLADKLLEKFTVFGGNGVDFIAREVQIRAVPALVGLWFLSV
jgi:hypothetical protein